MANYTTEQMDELLESTNLGTPYTTEQMDELLESTNLGTLSRAHLTIRDIPEDQDLAIKIRNRFQEVYQLQFPERRLSNQPGQGVTA